MMRHHLALRLSIASVYIMSVYHVCLSLPPATLLGILRHQIALENDILL